MRYVWQARGWPDGLVWDDRGLSSLLGEVSRAQGRLLGRMEALGFKARARAQLAVTTNEIVQSSDIEGERLDAAQVRSSAARRMQLSIGGLVPSDERVDGIVAMTLDATTDYQARLTQKRLHAWHRLLFPAADGSAVRRGRWRDDHSGPMQVVSGPIGKERVHYEAPPASRVPEEMKAFLRAFERPGKRDALMHAGLAHFWFVTVHPFEDGNGRIARVIADMALSRADNNPQRFYSMSAQVRRERDVYYTMLERTQRSSLDITEWQEWFLRCLSRAIAGADDVVSGVLAKADFWRRFPAASMNERQVKMLNALHDGFEGKLTSSKWAKITKCSQDTAHRDIVALIERGVLRNDGSGGRSTSYSLAAGPLEVAQKGE